MRIKDVFKEKGVTLKDVAARMGVKPPSLSRAINENTTVEMLNRIAAALDVPVVELFERPVSGNISCPKCGSDLKLTLESISKD